MWGGRSRHMWRRNRRGHDELRPWSVKDTESTQEEEDRDFHPDQ